MLRPSCEFTVWMLGWPPAADIGAKSARDKVRQRTSPRATATGSPARPSNAHSPKQSPGSKSTADPPPPAGSRLTCASPEEVPAVVAKAIGLDGVLVGK